MPKGKRNFRLYVCSCYSRIDEDFNTKFALNVTLNTWHEANNKKLLVKYRTFSLFVREIDKYEALKQQKQLTRW